MSNEKEQAKRSAKLIAGLAAFAIAATCLAPSGTPAAPSEAHAYTQVEKIVPPTLPVAMYAATSARNCAQLLP